MTNLLLACIAFVGTHFLLSHPLRAGLVARIGAGPFLGVYSLVAFVTLGWMIFAYRALPPQMPAWTAPDAAWIAAAAVLLLASVLLVGSLIANPAVPDPTGRVRPPTEARGVYAITRHPMMWAFAIWAVVHILIWPTAGNIAICAAILVLAIFGSLAQDRKKQALMGDAWVDWERRTSWLPFLALVSGRARWAAAIPRIGIVAVGVALWLAASWAHLPLAGIAVGVWR